MNSPAPLPLDGAHWAFSLDVYGRESVPASCLMMQDRWGVDVNLLLMAAYAAAIGNAPDADAIAAADRAIAPWREEIVKGLRVLRRRLKDGPPPAPSAASNDLRNLVKAAELMAEQIQQASLAALLATGGAQALSLAPSAGEAAIVDALRLVLRHHAGAAALADPETDEALRKIGAAVSGWRKDKDGETGV